MGRIQGANLNHDFHRCRVRRHVLILRDVLVLQPRRYFECYKNTIRLLPKRQRTWRRRWLLHHLQRHRSDLSKSRHLLAGWGRVRQRSWEFPTRSPQQQDISWHDWHEPRIREIQVRDSGRHVDEVLEAAALAQRVIRGWLPIRERQARWSLLLRLRTRNKQFSLTMEAEQNLLLARSNSACRRRLSPHSLPAHLLRRLKNIKGNNKVSVKV